MCAWPCSVIVEGGLLGWRASTGQRRVSPQYSSHIQRRGGRPWAMSGAHTAYDEDGTHAYILMKQKLLNVEMNAIICLLPFTFLLVFFARFDK